MAVCDDPVLCVEVTTDSADEDVILIRETDPVAGSGPDAWVRTSRSNWNAFIDGVKKGNFDNV